VFAGPGAKGEKESKRPICQRVTAQTSHNQNPLTREGTEEHEGEPKPKTSQPQINAEERGSKPACHGSPLTPLI